MFCVYQKQIEKQCLLTLQIKKKPLQTIKTTVYEKGKMRIFAKRLVYWFGQNFENSLTLICMQNRPRKSICERSSQKKVCIILCNPLYSHVIDRDNKCLKNCFRRFRQQTSLSEQRKHRVSKNHKISIFPKGLVHGFGQKLEIF